VGLKKKETKMSGERKSEVRKKKRKKKGEIVGLVLFEENSVDNGNEGLLEQKILVAGGRRRKVEGFRADSRAWDLKGCRHVCRARMSNMRS
jgi:hypothetical protein